MTISIVDLERSISDLEGQNSKFRRMRSLRIDPRNLPVCLYGSPIKTVGEDIKSTKKWPKMTSLSPYQLGAKSVNPENHARTLLFLLCIFLYHFRENPTTGTWSKRCDGQTDERTDERTNISKYISAPSRR